MTPAALAALHAAAMRVPAPYSAAEFAALLGRPGVFLRTVESGFVLGRVAADEAELLTIAVAPQAQRSGRGAALLAAFEAEAAQAGAAQGFLEVALSNAPARKLYRAANWAECGRRPGYYRLPEVGREDALILGKSLKADA